MIVTRFAPSPTGFLHLGHAWSAVRAHDLARSATGRFVLRIEDIDRARCREPFVDAILADLSWLGLAWDGPPVVQTTRAREHAAALDRLKSAGLIYPCTCTRAEIAQSAPHGPAGAIYPGTCRGRARDEAGPETAWRLDVARAATVAGPLSWWDRDREIVVDARAGGDVVLARKGLGVAYHLAAVVDDAAAGVTDVVRGADLVQATPVQRLLQALLGLRSPRYHHHALIVGPDGTRLAKRTAGATLADLRREGADPAVLLGDLRAGRLPVGFAFDAP